MPDTHARKIITNFGRFAEQYGEQSTLQQAVAQELLSALPKGTTPKRILEIGCGTGNLTHLLSARFPSAHITATDVTPEMLREVQRKITNTSHIETMHLNGEDITPLQGQTFDLIISNMTVQWLGDIQACYDAWQRILAPSGTILTSRPAENCFPEWRDSLAHYGYQSGLLPFQSTRCGIAHITIPQEYGSTLNFLRSMRTTGAATPHPDYTPLTHAQIKHACTHCDAAHNGRITWHIQIDTIKN